MQKPLAYANDLAHHDVLEDDAELVFGPHPSKLSGPAPAARQQQLGSSSFKAPQQDTSILGSAGVMAKLAQSLSVPGPSAAQPVLAPRYPVPDGHVYAGGNPIISTAPASRPGSALVRLPRTSAPSGGAAPTAEVPTNAASKSAHGGSAAGSTEASAGARQDGGSGAGEPRMQGDIQGGDRDRDRDNSGRPRSGLLRRLSSLTLRPVSARLEGAEGAAAASRGAGAAKGQSEAPVGRAPIESCGPPVRGSAIPCVEVTGERSRLLRKLSLRDAPAALASAGGGGTPSSRDAAARSAGQLEAAEAAQAQTLGADAAVASTTPCPEPPLSSAGAPAGTTSAAAVAAPAKALASASSRPPERPSTPLRRLTRLLSGSLISPAAAATATAAAAAASDQRDQDGAGAAKGRTSNTGVRELFSRPSSARRKSEAGSRGSQSQVPMEAWKHSRPSQPAEAGDDGPANDRVQEFGAVVVRQPSGVFKRAASALAAALAR